MYSRNRDWFIGVLIIVVTICAYQPAWNGKLLWDDDGHLPKPELRSLDGLARIWTQAGAAQQYYPLVFSAFWVEQKLWGDSTLGYHLVNLLLHACCALLFLRILRLLEVPGDWLAAAIFALHPVHVESVAWISELKNTLSGVFYLGSALAYLRFDQARSRKFYATALGLFILGLLSKTVIATLPVALLVIFWWKRGALRWRHDALPLVPFFVTGIAAGLLTAWVERKFAGAEGSEYQFSVIERFLIAGRAIWFYLGKLSWPAELAFIYPRWNVSQAVWWQYLYPTAALLLVLVLWRMRQWIGRGPLAAVLLYAGTLFPALGFFNVYPFRYSFVADHFQYLASLGIIALASAGVVRMLDHWRIWGRAGGNVLCLTLLATLACLTWRQSGMYTDMETLWRTTLQRNPECWLAHNNLGNTLLEKGEVEEAIVHFEKALEVHPDYGMAHYNLGTALFRTGQVDDAIAHFRKALEIEPDDATAHSNLGNALARKGRVAEAIAHFEKALEMSRTNAYCANNLAWVLATCPESSVRNGTRAVELAEQATHLSRTNDPMLIGTLAAAYAEAGRFDEAVATGEKARALARAKGMDALVARNEELLMLYRNGQPFHER